MAAISTPAMARAARACVSVIFPPPINPMWIAILLASLTKSLPQLGPRSHAYDEVHRRSGADISDSMLLVRTDEPDRTGLQVVMLVSDRKFDRPFPDQPHLRVRVVMSSS